MPLFDYLCLDCGQTIEVLVAGSTDHPTCESCGSSKLKKLLSAPASMSGVAKQTMPGPGDTACCGTSPSQASCAGPGSCCGRAH